MSLSSSSKFWNEIVPDINTSDGKLLFTAIVSLLVVVCLVIILHIYARCVLGRAHRRSIQARSIIGPLNHIGLHQPNYDGNSSMNHQTEGLDAATIALLPLFVYNSEAYKPSGLDCVVCLSVFEDEDVGRVLPNCKHAFHLECVDRWLGSNSTCPICRTNVVLEKAAAEVNYDEVAVEGSVSSDVGGGDVQIEIPAEAEHKRSASSPSPVLPILSMGTSLKRMLSMNRLDHKVFLSPSVRVPTV